MLNPDGVVLGNYRSSLAGLDLNRQWKRPSEKLTPTVFKLKELLRRERKRIVAFFDLHGHSRQLEAFTYGNTASDHPEVYVLPMLFAQNCPSFSYKKCTFGYSAAKSSTGRIVACRELGIHCSFTLEVSNPNNKTTHDPNHMDEP